MSEKKEIVGFTAGNFDLMHPGYIYTFEDARKHCDKFIVFLQRDPSLHRKSKYKPVVPLYERYRTLMAIQYIDEVYVYQTEDELYDLGMEEAYCSNEFFDSRNKGEETSLQVGVPNEEWTKTGGFQPLAYGENEY